MKNLIQFFSDKGILSNLIFFFVFIVGINSSLMIKRDVFPNITFDMISIGTPFPGASPSEVEKLITSPLEQDLTEIDGIKTMSSSSSENRSFILLELDPDEADPKDVKSDVQEIIDRFSNRPEGAEDSLVESIQSKFTPIIEISLFGKSSEEKKRELAKILEKEIETLPEVARVVFEALRDYEIKVEAKLKKLRSYDLSLEDLISALNLQNQSIPGGVIKKTSKQNGKNKEEEFLIRTVGEFQDVSDVKSTVIRANDLAQVIRVQDVANVSMDFKKLQNIHKTNGEPSINLTILKKEKSDAIHLVDKVKNIIDDFFKNPLNKNLTKGTQYEYINDSSYYIRRRLSVLLNNLALGLVLVLIFLSLALPWRVAFITSLGIPFSFLGALIYFYYAGVSVNLISLIGLIIVIGMLVDDAVVVTENAQRHVENGTPPLKASILGAQEMLVPILASVSTTIVAFLPLVFMPGIFGKFVKYIPIGVIAALIASVFECFLILPHHFYRWGVSKKTKFKDKKSLKQTTQKSFWWKKVVPLYLRILNPILRFRWFVVFGSFCFFIFSLYFATTKMRFILFPAGGIEIFHIDMKTAIGTPLEETLRLIQPIEDKVKKMPSGEMENFVTRVGLYKNSGVDLGSMSGMRGTERAQIYVYLTPFNQREKHQTSSKIIERLRQSIGHPKGLEQITFSQLKPGPPVGRDIDVGVRGEDYKDILKGVLDLTSKVSEIEGVTDLENTFVLGKKEIQIIVSDAEMSASGLSVSQIGRSVRANYEGLVATKITKLDEEIDVRVSLFGVDKTHNNLKKTLLDLSVPNSQNRALIPLKNIARLVQVQSPSIFEHENNQRQVRLRGEINKKISNSREVNAKISKMLPYLKKAHPSLDFHFGGEGRDTKESLQSLAQTFVIAMMLIFVILILTFQNLLQTLLVLSSIPMGIMAVIWAFFLHDAVTSNHPLSFLSLMGIIAVSGVIVNNAIVFIDFVNKKRKEGFQSMESIKLAAQTRMRPIILTTLTTSAGILPTAYGWGGLDPFVVPIALSLGWGILFGAFLTMIILPASLASLDDISSFFSKKFFS